MKYAGTLVSRMATTEFECTRVLKTCVFVYLFVCFLTFRQALVCFGHFPKTDKVRLD